MSNKIAAAVNCGELRIGYAGARINKRDRHRWTWGQGLQIPHQVIHILKTQHPRVGQKTGKSLCGKLGVRICRMPYTDEILQDKSPLVCEACRIEALKQWRSVQ